MVKRLLLFVAIVLVLSTAFTHPAVAQTATQSTQGQQVIPVDLAKAGSGSLPLQIVVLLTLLSFIPAILISMTCFTRLIVVFHFLRQALGTQETPNNQVLIGLALFLTLFVMSPSLSRVNTEALQPMMAGQISQSEAISKALVPMRAYMLRQTRERDLALFIRLSGSARPRNADEVATTALIPAYMISELKTAFQIGFVLFIPFLVIDMAVSSVLLSMGMMQLPPVIVSMPLKLLLFVMVDGWYLIVGSLVKSAM
jgi:flagellar biosynthetic protein FliP